jgi:hypothetical protein
VTARPIPPLATIARRSGLVAALGVTALVLAGCASSATLTRSSGNLPKLHIGGGSEAGPVAAEAPAPAAAVPNAAAQAPMIHVSMFGGYALTGSLPASPTHAPIWTWSGDKATQADIQQLATALGVQGTPQRHPHGWELTTSTADLRVSDDSGHPWSYNKTGPTGCPTYQVDIDDPDDVTTGCATSAPAQSVQPVDGPDETATKAAAASLLSALAISGDEQFDSGTIWSTLTVSPRIGGLATQGIETTVSVDASGIAGATGDLKPPTEGADYPLRTASSAFTALQDLPRPMIASFCGRLPVDGSATTDGGSVSVEGSPSGTDPGGLVSPASSAGEVTAPPDSPAPTTCPTPEPEKVTGATLGLQVEYGATDDGSAILAPAWFFTTADGGSPIAIVAIDPSYLEGPSVASASPETVGPVSVAPATPVPFPPAARASVATPPSP